MNLFTYLMAKNGQNTQKDLFSYLLGKKASGGSGTYTTFSGTLLNISNTIKAKIKNFMLNSTELTQDGTPTPDTPQDIHVIKGSNNIKITDGTEEQNYPITLSSNNLAYTGWAEDFVNRINDTTQAELLTYDNKNCLKFRNDAGSGGHDNKYMLKIGWKENTQYTFVFDLLSVSGYFNFSIDYTDGTYSYINGSQSANEWRSVVWASDANKTIKYLRVRNITGLSYVDLDTFMVLEGTYTAETVPDYEPYYNLEYCKIGDYADQFFKNTTDSEFYDSTLLENEWYLKKNTRKIVPDGKGRWNFHVNAAGNNNFYYASQLAKNVVSSSLQKCNMLKYAASNYNYGGNQTFEIGNTTVVITSNNFANSDELNAFLNENPLIFYVPISVPEYIHISESDYPILRNQLEYIYNNAKSYNGQTNITQTNEDLPFNISVDVKVANL